MPAHGDDIYSVVVPTLADSTIAAGQHWTAFLVRAATAAPTVFFDSAPDSGYSLDNLAPGAPTNLLANSGQVVWDPAPEADFDYFTVYGSDSPTRDGSETQLTQTIDPTFDAGGLPYPYILVSATDFAGNEGPVAAANTATGLAPWSQDGRLSLSAQPNPFGARTSVAFALPRAMRVQLAVFDAAGRLVRTLADGMGSAGRQDVAWDGRDSAGNAVANGVYLVRLTADGQHLDRKLVLVR